jgi:hypothetical protein
MMRIRQLRGICFWRGLLEQPSGRTGGRRIGGNLGKAEALKPETLKSEGAIANSNQADKAANCLDGVE